MERLKVSDLPRLTPHRVSPHPGTDTTTLPLDLKSYHKSVSVFLV